MTTSLNILNRKYVLMPESEYKMLIEKSRVKYLGLEDIAKKLGVSRGLLSQHREWLPDFGRDSERRRGVKFLERDVERHLSVGRKNLTKIVRSYKESEWDSELEKMIELVNTNKEEKGC